MNYSRTCVLSFLVAACGQTGTSNQQQAAVQAETDSDVRAEFLRLAGKDPWAKWPDQLREDSTDDGQPCQRVSEQSRERAIARLAKASAVTLDTREYQHLTGTAAPPVADGAFYLLRGFSSTNSAARVKVTGNGVTVHSDALGGLFRLQRHPCIAVLKKAPSEVYTVAAYDL